MTDADQAAERIAAYIEARAQAAQYQETPRPDGIARLAAPFGHQLNETDLIAVVRDWAAARARVAELEGELVQREDDVPARITAELDRDEARRIARAFLSPLGRVTVHKALSDSLGLDALPDWLTEGEVK